MQDIDSFNSEEKFEGKIKSHFVNYYERVPDKRAKAILIHGTTCIVCKFNFENFYGERGANYIEVHHIRPLSSLKEETNVDPETDMVVLCANCHRMIHRKKDNILSIEELRQIVEKRNKS